MKYDDFYNDLNRLGNYIQELKKQNITDPNIITNLINLSFFVFPKNINYHCVVHFNYVIKTASYIRKFIEKKTNEISLDNIIDILNKKEFTKTDNINIVYEDLLKFMISNEIVSDIYFTDYSPMIIDPTPIPINFTEFIPRINQVKAFEYLEKYGLTTCIHCQATGCGKTYIILRYIEYACKLFKNNTKIILFTERVNILKDLFDFSDDKNNIQIHKPNKERINKWKKKGIADLTNIDIINCVTKKDSNWINKIDKSLNNKPTLVVINRAYLTLKKDYYDKFNNINLILHDECHNTTSKNCNELLLKCLDFKIPIVGFSATPLRTGKNDKEKLLDIYGDDNNNLNLATNFNMIYAVSQKLILPPEFYWYHISIDHLNILKKENHDSFYYEYDTVATLLNKLVENLPSKKIVAWCGKISLAEKWQNAFIENKKFKYNLHNFKFYLDTSINSDDDYKAFKKSDGECILFCANKHREGSDIRRLDTCIFLDGVVNRGCIPFIQSIGRVLRIDDENPEKKTGVIIDGIYKTIEDNNYEKDFVDKIIGYYMALENISENLDESNTAYEKYIKLKDIIKFDKEREIITLNFSGNIININMNKLEWESIVNKFDSVLQNKIKMSDEDRIKHDYKELKEKIKNMFTHKKDYIEYANINNLITNPDIIYKEYGWINWYDFLGIDTSIYPDNKNVLLILCDKYNINSKESYEKKANKYNLPLMPEELYKDFTSYYNEFNDDNESRR